MKFSEHGETFISRESDMINLCGAYLLSEFRGKGVYDALLGYAASVLAREGYVRIGVDFESFNPTARGFWLKHFTPYTTSVVRRIN
jgi:GNAT superfamily N-acetyltransferase